MVVVVNLIIIVAFVVVFLLVLIIVSLVMVTCKLELHIYREWNYFNYVRFTCEVGSLRGKDVVSGINL